MPKRKFDPSDPDVIDAIVEDIRKMTPEEALAFLMYRTPGVEETDMTGMFSDVPKPQRMVRTKRRAAAAV